MSAPRRAEGGFTVVEVLIAILVLSVGVLALVGSSATNTKVIGGSMRSTRAAAEGALEMEKLRRVANSTSPRCTALANGNAAAGNGVASSWTVVDAGNMKRVTVVVTNRSARRTTTDTIQTLISCT